MTHGASFTRGTVRTPGIRCAGYGRKAACAPSTKRRPPTPPSESLLEQLPHKADHAGYRFLIVEVGGNHGLEHNRLEEHAQYLCSLIDFPGGAVGIGAGQ